MRSTTLLALILLLAGACTTNQKKDNSDSTTDQLQLPYSGVPPIVTTQAQVLSVKEELIMPSDYLTTSMAVKTAEGDTLVFSDMEGLEKLGGKTVTIKYQLLPSTKLIACFDCTSMDEKVALADVTTVVTPISFEMMKLQKFNLDPYITIASTFDLEHEDGSVGIYYSNVEGLEADTVNMSSGFFSYGIVQLMSTTIKNKEELMALVQ